MAEIKPMLAAPSTSAGNRVPVDLTSLVGTHTFDLKLDGLRALAYWDGATLRLVNRSGVEITALFPEITRNAASLGAAVVLDGEIVADDSFFETVALRGKQTQTRTAMIATLAASRPCQYVAFDLLDDLAAPYATRRAALERRGTGWQHPFSVSIASDSALIWDHVLALGLEGVIAKDNRSRYQPGRRSRDWLKFKTTRRITCVAVGYEPGEGSRARFGAMHLALLGPNGPVRVGRVGTGFTEKDITDLKTRLDAGELFCVEIETLNRTGADQLRFPVFKGVRSDLSPVHATLDQLDALPRC